MAGLFSKQGLPRCVGFRLGFPEIQIRLVVGMLGALRLVQQAFDGQQHTRI
jgi:hypothetical protein